MPTIPRSPNEHYQDAVRLLAAADETPRNAPMLAVAHAVLATVPRKTLRGRHRGNPTPPTDDTGRGWGWPG